MRKRHFSKEAVKARLDEMYDSADALLKISPVALDVLDKLSKGKAEVKFQLEGLDKAVSRFNRMVNRLINALIISAIIIGSAVIVGVEGSSIYVPLSTIGTIGFIVAGVAGIWLLIDILRSGHM
jgi:ubiquinone biosynthesis protein